jgi:predicted phage terminase large subunit-like protein
MITYFDAYPSLFTVPGQPWSFSAEQFEGKRADLGMHFSPLYQQNPLDRAHQMFPPGDFQIIETLNINQVILIVSPWDTGSKTEAANDESCNVPIAAMADGSFLVLDCFSGKFGMDTLPQIVVERLRVQARTFRNVPLCVIEDAGSGIGLIQFLERQGLPVAKAVPVKSKPIRAMSVQPYTAARSVFLLKGEWNEQFITDMANFPVSSRDHSVDAFVHGMRALTATGSANDFRKPNFRFQSGNTDKTPAGFWSLGSGDLGVGGMDEDCSLNEFLRGEPKLTGGF